MIRLTQYQKIALDLDGTLIDGEAAFMLANFVKEYPDKSFFIITFRTPDQTQNISQELAAHDLTIDLFDKIIPMPKRYVFDFDADQRFRRNAKLPRLDQVSQDALLPGEFKLMHWKGFIANKLGASVLVDDMPYLVRPGCNKFRIVLIDANQLAI